LEPTEETFRAILEHAPDAILISDSQGRIVHANDQAELMFGYGREEIIGRSIELLVPERFREAHVSRRLEHLAEPSRRLMGGAGNYFQARCKDGSELPVEISLSPCPQNGDMLVVATIHDASQRKEFEARLQRNIRELQILHDVSQIMINAIDLKDTVPKILDMVFAGGEFDIGVAYIQEPQTTMLKEVWNRGYRDPGRIRQLSSDPESPAAGQAQAEVFKTQGAYIMENLPLAAGHRTFKREGVESAIVVPIRVGNQITGTLQLGNRAPRRFDLQEVQFLETVGRQLGVAAQKFRLLEETTKNADELTLKILELEIANGVKDEFLSIMSHELRTPLNVIMGYIDLLHEGMLGEINQEQKDALRILTQQSNDLLGLISNVIRATQISGGSAKARPAPLSLGHFIGELESAHELNLGKQVTMTWRVPEQLPIVETDREMLTQILRHLIGNAAKFTEKGFIKIEARYSARTKTAVFRVADSGAGIPAKSLPIIFELFRQSDSSGTRLYGGTGLGLYIVKKYTELLGGKIKVQSRPGRGSVFTVYIPCRVSRPARSRRQPLLQSG